MQSRSHARAIQWCTAIFVFMSVEAVANDVPIKEQAAIEVANREASRLLGNLGAFEVDVDTIWNDHLRAYPYYVDKHPELAVKLKGKNYWAVSYYSNRLIIYDGGLIVFVDKGTGEVLAVIWWTSAFRSG